MKDNLLQTNIGIGVIPTNEEEREILKQLVDMPRKKEEVIESKIYIVINEDEYGSNSVLMVTTNLNHAKDVLLDRIQNCGCEEGDITIEEWLSSGKYCGTIPYEVEEEVKNVVKWLL